MMPNPRRQGWQRHGCDGRIAAADLVSQVMTGASSCSAGAIFAASYALTCARSSHLRSSNGASGIRRIAAALSLAFAVNRTPLPNGESHKRR